MIQVSFEFVTHGRRRVAAARSVIHVHTKRPNARLKRLGRGVQHGMFSTSLTVSSEFSGVNCRTHNHTPGTRKGFEIPRRQHEIARTIQRRL